MFGSRKDKMRKIKEEELESLLLKYHAALKTLETELSILLQDFEFQNKYNPVEHIKSRIKSYDSVVKKLTKKGYKVTIKNIEEQIHDMVGIRIICAFLPDIYKVVHLLEHSEHIKIYNRKDYITHPKNTGYSSYHLQVKVPVHLMKGISFVNAEIQIRTLAMDFWASLEHKIRYKFLGEVPQNIQENIYKCALDINELDRKMLFLNHEVQKLKQSLH